MLIGREIEVLASRDKTMLKLRGLVVNETKNLLVVNDGGRETSEYPKVDRDSEYLVKEFRKTDR